MFEMKREAKEETETPFMKNGRMLLEELIAFCNGEGNLIHVFFSAEELRRATYNYDPLQIFWMQMVFTFTRVLWKITYFQLKVWQKIMGYTGEMIKDIVIGSQMSVHQNVLKLFFFLNDNRTRHLTKLQAMF